MDISQRMHSLLVEKNVKHDWYIDSGGHTWPVWKNDLYLLAPRLFRDSSQPSITAVASARAASTGAGPIPGAAKIAERLA